jgi:hypothetical protein
MKDSVLRAQGRFGALHHPPPSLACRPAHKQEVADDRDRRPGLHRLPQRRYRLAGQPRVFGLHGRIDRKRPLRIVGDVEGKFGQADVSEPMIETHEKAMALVNALTVEQTKLGLPIQDDLLGPASSEEFDHFMALIEASPTTLAGVTALLTHLDRVEKKDPWKFDDNHATPLIAGLARALNQIAG